jgi:hypothetical protein
VYEIYLWRPARGWMLIKRTKNQGTALKWCDDLYPLETRLRRPDATSTYYGRPNYPDYRHVDNGRPSRKGTPPPHVVQVQGE